MKKLLAILLAALMAVSVLAGCSGNNDKNSSSQAESSAEASSAAESSAEASSEAESSEEVKDLLTVIKERGYLTIGTEGCWSPWTYHDETTNELTGMDVELGKLIAEGLGVEARFEEAAWDSLLAGVDAGRFDMVCNGVGVTEDRIQKYDFSDPYVYTATVLIVKDDNTDINSFEDLKGKTTANTASSTYAQKAESYGATVTPIDSFEETIALLLQGRIDATLNSKESYLDYIKQHPDSGVKIVAEMSGDKVAIPVSKENTETLVAEVNRILEELRSNGKLAELSNQFFGGDMTKE